MSYHLIQTIFINLPITAAFDKLWQLIGSADGLQAFNHYFKTNKILNRKANSFTRQISLRFASKANLKISPQDQSVIIFTQEVTKIQKQRKIIYKNLTREKQLQVISGEFFHQLEQNNKGQTYLIFGSSAKNGSQNFPQKSEAQIQLIKLKDFLENGFTNQPKTKNSIFQKCC